MTAIITISYMGQDAALIIKRPCAASIVHTTRANVDAVVAANVKQLESAGYRVIVRNEADDLFI